MSKPAASKLWSIQYLRALAAIWVVLFHQLNHHSWIFRIGSHGVDIFFVISGFIMVAMTDGRGIGPARFLLDRVARIVPIYWLATALCFVAAAAGWHFYAASARPDLLIRSLLFVPAINDGGMAWPTLFLGWTLNYEMFFYALFALSLFAHERLRLPLLGAAFAGLVLLGAATRPPDAILRTYTSPLLLEFLAGAVLGKQFGADLRRRSWPATLGSIAALLVASGLMAAILPGLSVAPFAIVLVAGGLLAERCGLVPKIRLLKLLGDASFAIYLFQQFAFEAVRATFGALSAAMVDGLSCRLVSVALAIMLGVALFRFLERPLTRTARAALFRLTHIPARLRDRHAPSLP